MSTNGDACDAEHNNDETDINKALRKAEEQQREREALEKELKELEQRRDIAKRRLVAYELEKNGDGESSGSGSVSNVWLKKPSDIAKMKRRLEDAMKDEKILMGVVNEVKEKRETLTADILRHYQQRAQIKRE